MQVLFSKKFRKMYVKLPKSLQQHFDERLELFLTDPSHPLLHKHPLTAEWIDHLSINVTGNYRAIYRHESSVTVRFVAIGTHAELYGK